MRTLNIVHLLLFDPISDQTQNEIDQRVNRVVMFLTPKVAAS